jgi:hypothetical protein
VERHGRPIGFYIPVEPKRSVENEAEFKAALARLEASVKRAPSSPVDGVPPVAAGPPALVYRVGSGLDAFAPPDWAYALPDGIFDSNRLLCFVYFDYGVCSGLRTRTKSR